MNDKFVALNMNTGEILEFGEKEYNYPPSVIKLLGPGQWDIMYKWQYEIRIASENMTESFRKCATAMLEAISKMKFRPIFPPLGKVSKENEMEVIRTHYGQYAIETEGFDVLGTIDTIEEFDEDENIIRVKADLVIEGDIVKTMEWKSDE